MTTYSVTSLLQHFAVFPIQGVSSIKRGPRLCRCLQEALHSRGMILAGILKCYYKANK